MLQARLPGILTRQVCQERAPTVVMRSPCPVSSALFYGGSPLLELFHAAKPLKTLEDHLDGLLVNLQRRSCGTSVNPLKSRMRRPRHTREEQ